MSFVKISDLPAATQANATDQLETNQGGTSRRLTVAQVATHVRSGATDTLTAGTGTVSAPGLTFTGDTNTGIYSPAADTIAFTEGGVEAMRIDSSANVGIGTTNPAGFSSKLAVYGASGSVRTYSASGGSTAGDVGEFFAATGSHFTYLQQQGNGNAALYGNAAQLLVGSSAASPVLFYTSGSERMRIDASGRVGVGTSTPLTRFTVAADALAPATQPFGDFQGNGQFFVVGATNSDKRLALGVDTTSATMTGVIQAIESGISTRNLLLNPSGGDVGIGTSTPAARLQVSGPDAASALLLSGATRGARFIPFSTLFAIEGVDQTGSGSYQPLAVGGSQVLFTIANTERMRIDASGNVGIGTTSPASYAGANDRVLTVFNTDQNLTLGARYQIGVGQLAFINSGNANNTGATNLALMTGGVERMLIGASGNVGIGTSAPGNKLDIVNTGSSQIRVKDGVNATAYYDFGRDGTDGFFGFSGAQTTFSGYKWSVNAGTEVMRITNAGNVGIGTASPGARLDVVGGFVRQQTQSNSITGNHSLIYTNSSNVIDFGTYIDHYDNGVVDARITMGGSSGTRGLITFGGAASGGASERMRITAGGNLLVGKTAVDNNTPGSNLQGDGFVSFCRNANTVQFVNRNTSDGELVAFLQDGVGEGSISVSGTTVSYNGGHLARWSQLPTKQRDPALLKGTVLSNLDEMCEWLDEEGNPLPNEQLNRMKVSDVEGDPNVAGVFVNWDNDDQANPYDMNIAMTGDMIIRIAPGIVVQKGDLLMSAGDGTAKPQGDDIVRSKTVAKVTSNHVTCTHPDGSYCVPCVLMAC